MTDDTIHDQIRAGIDARVLSCSLQNTTADFDEIILEELFCKLMDSYEDDERYEDMARLSEKAADFAVATGKWCDALHYYTAATAHYSTVGKHLDDARVSETAATYSDRLGLGFGEIFRKRIIKAYLQAEYGRLGIMIPAMPQA